LAGNEVACVVKDDGLPVDWTHDAKIEGLIESGDCDFPRGK
jgi:hypothetical protein